MPVEKRFLREVRDLLQHFYDYPYLQDHRLVQQLLPEQRTASPERVRALRAIICDAIAELKPSSAIRFRSEAARSYNVLSLRYVEAQSIAEVAGELALSERQTFRHLRKAERDLAAILWSRRSWKVPPSTPRDGSSQASPVLREAQRLNQETEVVFLQSLLDGVLAAVSRLSDQLGVQLHVRPLPDPAAVDTDRVVAKQALINTMSYALQKAQPNSVVFLSADPCDSGARIEITYRAKQPTDAADAIPAAAQELVKSLGGECSVVVTEEEMVSITLALAGVRQTMVLVIDDNEGLVELFRRYLTGEGYQLVGARDGSEGLRLAEEQTPDLIVLDIMMPRNDGFEVLQWLQTRAATRRIPVVVCSVLDDPQLAFSLGATDFLAKPVKPGQLLAVLSRCRTDSLARSHPAEPEGT